MAKTKKQELEEKVIKYIQAGKDTEYQTVDFSDPNRPKTILEVDFPILPVNQIASIEGNSSKPIYQMSKWWARRRSSIFRTMLLTAAMKAPEDPINAAKEAWSSYYKNHQNKGSLKKLKVADVFMGGGTTIVEGSRLGMQMHGNDLNPIAWLVVKNELAKVDFDELKKFEKEIELEVKPKLMPYFSCSCPRGHHGEWLKFQDTNVPITPFYDNFLIDEPSESEMKKFKKSVSNFEGWSNWYKVRGYNFEIMPQNFNPFSITEKDRSFYRYWGPEIVYTYWAKHGPCQNTGCNHKTPIMVNPEIFVKELSVKTWIKHECSNCSHTFDIEQKEARMAPSATLVISPDEESFAIADENGDFECPNCQIKNTIQELDTKQAKNKKISLTLLVNPSWLKGSKLNGGKTVDETEETIDWNNARAKNISLIEVRGKLPEYITCPETGNTFSTGAESGSNKGRGKFVCSDCGTQQQLSNSLSLTGHDAPVSAYAYHGYCPDCSNNGEIYNGRFFESASNIESYNQAVKEWEAKKTTHLKNYWPEGEIKFSHQTHQRDNLPNHGYSHWWKLFNKRQLLILSTLLKSIVDNQRMSQDIKDLFLGAFQLYIRNQNMFCFWDKGYDKLVPFMSNNNYHPKMNVVENSIFSELGRGNWNSSLSAMFKAEKWKSEPYELVSTEYLKNLDGDLSSSLSGKSHKVMMKDKVLNDVNLTCGSSTELDIEEQSMDLIITDPPFGDNVQYAELADFFYVWLQLGLSEAYPNYFSVDLTPKALEAVTNKARHPENPDEFYKRILTEVWRESNRVLKPGGILAFTFHHSEDEPWIAVLESLFEAGFYLEATYPIRSDESKGENAEFGSKKIEYDIIHVCRKRTEEPKRISWARLRKRMIKDIRQLEAILANHLASGLTESDLQVIRRGKALEYFSKHYGSVYVEEGRLFTVKEALVGINQILDEEKDINLESPPVESEVMSRQILRIFTKTSSVSRNEMQNFLRGTGLDDDDFKEKNWIYEKNRTFFMVSPADFARNWKGRLRKGLSHDLDQTLFFIGACFDNSEINVNETLSNSNFKLHPAVIPLLSWFTRNSIHSEIRQAAMKAHHICSSWRAKNPEKENEQLALFGLNEEE
ncbi:DNA methylase [Planococcus glaciei]|uniref:site-specific DNA-methyltransferase n=1 Tax=Planococcus glaciei TaxID=459472 RepID=UPI00088BF29E|nr:site-specific DNA-methyltransferase [Planococcus glaciei]SDG75019.1 DNA methylase [Planococcus glaciei]